MRKVKRIYLTLAGEDKELIRRCDGYVQHIFGIIRCLVLLIFIGCCVSAGSFIFFLFQGNKWMAVPVGIVWALLVTNMYLLLLHTVTPTLLPVKNKILARAKSFLSVDMLFRLFFMSLLAVIIAQPINVLCLSPFALKSLNKYKTEYRAEMMIAADSALVAGECRCGNELNQVETQMITPDNREEIQTKYGWLHNRISEDSASLSKMKLMLDSLKRWHGRFSDHWKHVSDSVRANLETELAGEQQSCADFLLQLQQAGGVAEREEAGMYHSQLQLQHVIAARVSSYKRLQELMEHSNFYIKRNQIILNENPVSWIITVLVIGVFLLPICLKYSIRKKGNFYQKKEQLERDMVLERYQCFKSDYLLAFKKCIEKYNTQSRERMLPWLEKLRGIRPDIYPAFIQRLEDVLRDEVEKYEYWADHPFRTVRKYDAVQLSEESDLLTLIYPDACC